MQLKVKETLENRTGSLEQKPPWMKGQTFQKLRREYVKYDEKYLQEVNKELFRRFGVEDEFYSPPSGMYDAYVEREDTREFC